MSAPPEEKLQWSRPIIGRATPTTSPARPAGRSCCNGAGRLSAGRLGTVAERVTAGTEAAMEPAGYRPGDGDILQLEIFAKAQLQWSRPVIGRATPAPRSTPGRARRCNGAGRLSAG